MKRGEIYNQIVKELNDSLNIQQISTRTQIRWETIRNAVEALTEAGFLEREGNKYSLKRDFHFDEDTLLGIHIPEEKKKQIAAIANRIKELKEFKNTFLQKAVIKVIEKTNLDLPYGWYLYGPCSALKLTPDVLKKYRATKKYDDVIKETISELSQYKDTNELMEAYYKDNPVYLARLQIDQIFKAELTKNSMRQIELALQQMLFKMDNPAEYYISCFISSIAMLKKQDQETLNDLKLEIYTTFRAIWEIIGTQSLKETMNVGDFYYNNRMEVLKENAYSYLLSLKDSWPEMEYSEDIKKLKDKYLK